ncbi:oligosaccharide flippase family protein [Paraburkholderia panacisoli]|uniref:Oligosaccharide flippase family protein n=1 Tax=Paraburkholderia panacisoli TaxID=2603818 RepID=A0A5B0H6B5_9BURK|nr:oligosaccharide flippase family protein [Paraburkholderia panacisoli]KAA1010641.1 oligosaccharide flippase family protein [Paraburkholderia panacisoli]
MKSFRTLLFSSLSGVVCEKVIGALAAVASNHLFATLYGAHFFGELQFALSLAYVVSSAALIFSAQAVAPIFGRHPRLRHLVFYRAFRLRLGSTLSVTLLFLIVVGLLMQSSSTALTLIAGLVMLCEPISLGSLMAYAETKPWVITRAKAYASGVRVLWLLGAAHASVGAVVASFAWPLEAYVAAAAPFSRYRTLAFHRPRSLHGSEMVTRTLIVRGLRIWPAIAATVLVLRMDRLLLGTLMSKTDLGIYSAAASLVEQWNSVGTTLALALAPAMVFIARDDDQLRSKAIKLSAYLAVIAAVALVGSLFVGRAVFLLIYGPAFEAGVPVMIFGTACSIATFVDAGLTTWLIAARRYRLMTVKLIVTIVAIGAAPFVMPSALMMYAPAAATAVSVVLFWAAVFGQGQRMKVAL